MAGFPYVFRVSSGTLASNHNLRIVHKVRIFHANGLIVAFADAYGLPLGPPAILHAYIKNEVAVRSIAGSFVE